MLFFSGIDLYNFTMLSDNTVKRYVLQVIVQLVFFSIIYIVIYTLVKNFYFLLWKRKNKKNWIKGSWLQIHVKNDLRIGTVEIAQNFNTIEANGHNFTPKGHKTSNNKKETTWKYLLANVKDEKNARDFIGCYTADDISNQTSKDGVHVLQIMGVDNKTGYANYMVGGFRDTFKITDKNAADAGDHAGELYFYRMSNKCKRYLYEDHNFRYDRLISIHENPDFATEPFVMKLKACLENLPVESVEK